MRRSYYLAYGSNLNIPQMRRRCPDAKIAGTGLIKDYRLLFKGSKTGAYLTIEKAKGYEVPVAIWAVSQEDKENLDMYEGFPTFYYTKDFSVDCEMIGERGKRRISAFAYIMHEERLLGIPTGYYLDICLDGYKAFGFNEDYIWDAYATSKVREKIS